jgi:hypothetical protein
MARAGVRARCDDRVKDTAPDSAMGGEEAMVIVFPKHTLLDLDDCS